MQWVECGRVVVKLAYGIAESSITQSNMSIMIRKSFLGMKNLQKNDFSLCFKSKNVDNDAHLLDLSTSYECPLHVHYSKLVSIKSNL